MENFLDRGSRYGLSTAVGSQTPIVPPLEGIEGAVVEAQSSCAGDVREGSWPRRIQIHPKLYNAAVEGDVELLEEFPQSQDFKNLQGVSIGGNTVLHIAATSSCDLTRQCKGDHVDFAEVVYNRNRALLKARNKLNETPLHCAAKAGNYKMVEKLIQLLQPARADVQNGGGSPPQSDAHVQSEEGFTLQTILTARNMHGETALHEAVRIGHKDMVEKLIDSEPSLTGIVDAEGVSPLYLATMTNGVNIVKIFTSKDQSMVSCAGPNGKTALHAAVLEHKGITRELLEWNKSLATKVDDLESTPLHYAASVGNEDTVELLLQHDKSAAFMADKDGLFPIHIAAKCGRALLIKELVEKFPDSDELLDKEGRNFLHLAIVSGKGNIIGSICRNRTFLRMLNARDYQGNTPLHLAGERGEYDTVRLLISMNKVYPNIMNRDGRTPVDLAMKKTEHGFMHRLNTQYNLLRLLMWAEGLPSPCRVDRVEEDLRLPKYDPNIEIEKAESTIRSLGIISVLTATVTFAASFTMPGGYIADANNQLIGSPVLSGKYLFKAFTVANTLAFVSSILATSWLVYAGSGNVEIKLRMKCLAFSVKLVKIATKATVCAFALATSAVLYQVNMTISILICAVIFVLVIFSNPSLGVFLLKVPIMKRQGLGGLVKSINPLTSERVDVGIGNKFSYMFFQVNVGVGQRFSTMIFYRILMNCVMFAIIFLFALF